jgi:hypothetical protein
MREVQDLRAATSTIPAAAKPAWGNPQRFLVAGLVVFLLAAIAAIILYPQLSQRRAGRASPEDVRQYVKSLPLRESIKYFHLYILPGIDSPEPPEVERKRNMVYLGMGASAAVGAIGLILAAVGVAGIVRR